MVTFLWLLQLDWNKSGILHFGVLVAQTRFDPMFLHRFLVSQVNFTLHMAVLVKSRKEQ